MLDVVTLSQRAGSYEKLGKIAGVNRKTAFAWKRYGSIPMKYWNKLLESGVINKDEYVELIAQKLTN